MKLNRKVITCITSPELFLWFLAAQAREKLYEYCRSNGQVKVKKPSEKEKWLKFHDGQCQFKVPFMIYVDFESISKPVDKNFREKINQVNDQEKK